MGQDDKDNSSNRIFLMMTTMKKRLWRIARHLHSRQGRFLPIYTSYMEEKQKSRKHKSTRHPRATLYPAQRLMSRRLRDIIPTAPRQLAPHTVSPSLVQENIPERRRRSKAQYDKRVSVPLAEFSEGDRVYVKPRATKKHQPWIYGEVIGRPAPRSCLVSTAMGPVRRNHAQIREAKAEPVDNYGGRLDRFVTASLPSESGPIEETDQPVEQETDQPVEQEPTLPPRRSTRERRFPSRFNDFLME